MFVYGFAEIIKGNRPEEHALLPTGKVCPSKIEKTEKQPKVPKKVEGKQVKSNGAKHPKHLCHPPKEDKDKSIVSKPKATTQKKPEKPPQRETG